MPHMDHPPQRIVDRASLMQCIFWIAFDQTPLFSDHEALRGPITAWGRIRQKTSSNLRVYLMARKKRNLHDLDCAPWDRNGTPWGEEADYYAKESGQDFEVCRDFVILMYLQYGDERALVDLLRTGKAPSPAVLRYMAALMGAPSSELHTDLPAKISVSGDNGHHKRERDLVWRDRLLNDLVEGELKKLRANYEVEIDKVAADYGFGKQTVRDAYDKRRPRK